MKKKVIVLLFFILFSCKNDFHVYRNNNDSDKREGEKITGTYFDNILLEKSEENLKLFSDEFFKQTNKEELLQEFHFIEEKLGKITSKEIQGWETSIVTGTSPKSEYLFVYDVERVKFNSIETFYLMKDSNDSIKIYSYKIDSKGLLK
jgi:hypothetical protein